MKVLDHGYIQLVERWGSDEAIIEAARMSTGKGFLGWGPLCPECGAAGLRHAEEHSEHPGVFKCDACRVVTMKDPKPGDEKLLRFLWENKHATPFEMAGVVIEVKAPIFVFREWHRHRTQSYSEVSARYVPLPDENYVPSVERLLINSKTNKQAGTVAGAAKLTVEGAAQFQNDLEFVYEAQQRIYNDALKAGVPKELARIHLPVGRYSRMRASANLRNWLAFLDLRMAPGAQWEIRQYANALAEMLKELFPRTLGLFLEKAHG